jgi:hypothetical protein
MKPACCSADAREQVNFSRRAIALESLKVNLTAEKAGMRAESTENTLGNRQKTGLF